MKKETYLKLKSQKRKAKLLAIFTALSLFGSAAKGNKVNAKEMTSYEQMVIEKIIKYDGDDYTVNSNDTIEDTNITTNNSLVNVNGEIFDTSGVTDEIIAYAKRGCTNGPQAYETWYPDNMVKVVENMGKLYGYTDLVYKVRNDGVKTLSGTAPDGTKFEDLIMIAADVRHPSANPDGTFERGEIVETTLGTGIIVDACGEAISKRKNNRGVHFDISTAWHSEPYISLIYGSNIKPTPQKEKNYTGDKIVLPPGITFDPERYISGSDSIKSKKS